jgi:DNA polymerase III epsilon subunit family exonuclease
MIQDIITFDVETTGLHPVTDRVIELAAVRWSAGQPVDTFQYLVNPRQPIPAESSAIHGIQDADVSTAPEISPVLQLFQKFVGSTPLAAHNAGFDIGFLTMECARSRMVWNDTQVLDTLPLSRAAFPELPSHRLDRLSYALRLGAVQHHRALADCMTAGRMMYEAFSRLDAIPPAAWMTWSSGLKQALPAKLKALQTALSASATVEILYKSDKDPRARSLQVKPVALMDILGRSYLYGHCLDVREDRTFRLDRVERADLAVQASLF